MLQLRWGLLSAGTSPQVGQVCSSNTKTASPALSDAQKWRIKLFLFCQNIPLRSHIVPFSVTPTRMQHSTTSTAHSQSPPSNCTRMLVFSSPLLFSDQSNYSARVPPFFLNQHEELLSFSFRLFSSSHLSSTHCFLYFSRSEQSSFTDISMRHNPCFNHCLSTNSNTFFNPTPLSSTAPVETCRSFSTSCLFCLHTTSFFHEIFSSHGCRFL